MVCDEVYSTNAKLWPLVMITSIPVGLYSAIIVVFCVVNVSAEWTNPLVTVLDPSHEWVDVSSAVLASHDGIILEGDGGNLDTLLFLKFWKKNDK